jgi:hypothetical protein
MLDATKEGRGVLIVYPEALEFLRLHGGPGNVFYRQLSRHESENLAFQVVLTATRTALGGFLSYLESGLYEATSARRQAQQETSSDFLEMAEALLAEKTVHPASAAMIVGATLEEFLRVMTDEGQLDLAGRKPGIGNYAQVLREGELLDKQDHKDLTSWGGLRNQAAHGEWEKVEDPERIDLMLQGVRLFIRKHTSPKA